MTTEFLSQIVAHMQMLLACAMSGSVLYFVYRRTSPNVTSEAEFASTVMVLAIATAFLVTIIKDSFAISIGLIGVLSIVRFRTAIKSPRQLMYIFVAVALGIANGAGEYLMAGLGVLTISALLFYFPVMPFDFMRPADQPRKVSIVARLSTAGPQPWDIGDVSRYLDAKNLPHQIKEASRTAQRTEIIIHFFSDKLDEIDRVLSELKGVPKLSAHNFEIELSNRTIAEAGI